MTSVSLDVGLMKWNSFRVITAITYWTVRTIYIWFLLSFFNCLELSEWTSINTIYRKGMPNTNYLKKVVLCSYVKHLDHIKYSQIGTVFFPWCALYYHEYKLLSARWQREKFWKVWSIYATQQATKVYAAACTSLNTAATSKQGRHPPYQWYKALQLVTNNDGWILNRCFLVHHTPWQTEHIASIALIPIPIGTESCTMNDVTRYYSTKRHVNKCTCLLQYWSHISQIHEHICQTWQSDLQLCIPNKWLHMCDRCPKICTQWHYTSLYFRFNCLLLNKYIKKSNKTLLT